MRSVRLVIPYFGTWPAWFPLYLESCATNTTFDWLFFTDCEPPANAPPNVHFERTTLRAYARRVSDALDIRFRPDSAYKVCDIRPALGVIHAAELAGYDNFGFGDIDLFYGELRRHYSDATLARLLVSNHARYVSGHLCLIRNTPLGKNLFRLVPLWRRLFEDPAYIAFEDRHFTRLFLGIQPHDGWISKLYRHVNPLWHMSSFEERFTTPLTWMPWTDGSHRHPNAWYWRHGQVTNDIDAGRTFPYIHFMNYKSSRYLGPLHGPTAAWTERASIVEAFDHPSWANGWAITPRGMEPLRASDQPHQDPT